MVKRYVIHPAIGFARVGTSQAFFLAPEIPGTYAKPDDRTYRDTTGGLKRQAVRFWVFEYDDADPSAPPRPIAPGASGVARIDWSVHLMNKKPIWFEFAGIIGEGTTGYPPLHPLRNASITDPAERQKNLLIDPGLRTVAADGTPKTVEVSRGTSSIPSAERWPPPFTGGLAITSLGTLLTDPEGRLTVAGGYGTSGTPGPLPPTGFLRYDNNDNWFDDISDGPITARVVLADETAVDATPAWVIVGPPDYAPPIENLVTTFDLLYDLGLREFGLDPAIFDPVASAFNPDFQPSFTRHIYPILRRALDYRWVITDADVHASSPRFDMVALAALPAPGETPATNPRDRIFRRLRDPDNVGGAGVRNMPRLHNDGTGAVPPETRRFTVTRFQFFAMKQWAGGQFLTGATDPAPVSGGITADGLDRAALEATCGGSFFPGMESGWILRDPRVYVTPFSFRFRHLPAERPTGFTPGDVTKRIALPWQADFLKCGNYWWPAQRPNQVLVGGIPQEWDRAVSSHVHLVNVWSQLGVVAEDPADPTRYVETERTLPEPS